MKKMSVLRSPWQVTGLMLAMACGLVVMPVATWAQTPSAVTPARRVVEVGVAAAVTEPAAARLRFSTNPTSEEIFQSNVFAEPLVPSGPVTPEENAALASALLGHASRTSADDFSAITGFLQSYPQSPWRVSLLLNLGLGYYRAGYFTSALDTWEQAWSAGREIPELRDVANQAVGSLAKLNAKLGRADRLEALFTELQGRQVLGAAKEALTGAREGLWLMRNKPEDAFRCGPMALDRVRASLNPADAFHPLINQSRSTPQGMSLTSVRQLASNLGMQYQMARRAPGAAMILPAVVHWKVNHYAAIVKEADGRLLVQDPTFREDFWISRAALDAEASGYFLVPAGELPAGWSSVSLVEADQVWGKGNTGSNDSKATKSTDVKCKTCPKSHAMAAYNMHAMVVSLNVTDIPLFYTPPRGPAIEFEVTYNQREAYQPATFTYSNLGAQWTFNWLSYVVDDSSIPAADAQLYVAGGGTEVYTGYDTASQTYARQEGSQAVLVRTSTSSFERRLPDGTKQIFNKATTTVGAGRKIFMTQIIDPVGNTVGLTYDGSFKLTTITDASGRDTKLTYNVSGDGLKIGKVTDPFGRFATFEYTAGQLTKITDTIGLTSEFTYDGSFVKTLKTAYGTTNFAYGDALTNPALPSWRWLEAVDPMGGRERLEYLHNAPGIASSDPAGTVPASLGLTNAYLNYRNSFFWDKKAMADAPGDYTKAQITHWLHTADGNAASGVVESTKEPLENRVWFLYPGQTNSIFVGTSELPSTIARRLDDGTTQKTQYTYNARGNITSVTDPVGRRVSYVYATNLGNPADPAIDVDLKEVRQTTGANNELLATFTYNTKHQPLTITDAAGQTTTLTYNTQGQPLTSTVVRNGVNETTTLSYYSADVSGKKRKDQLNQINGPLAGNADVTTLDYDDNGRVATVTDSEGYVVGCEYDALSRPTKVNYPDGSYVQAIYQRLDLTWVRDRQGRWTQAMYDGLGRVVSTTDPLGRTLAYDWCVCGALHSLKDAEGHTTRFAYDLQRRLIQKTYDDGSALQFTYENTTSRLKTRKDALNRVQRYQYFGDNRLQQVSYTDEAGGALVPPTPTVSLTYDANYPRVTSMTDGTGTTAFGYHPVNTGDGILGDGQLASVDGPLANDNITYSYDELGRRLGSAIDGVAETATVDALGRVTAVANPLGSFGYSYVNTTDRISGMTYPNGQTTAYSYYPNVTTTGAGNGDQRLQTIWNKLSGGTTLSKFDYGYSVAGDITSWQQLADSNPVAQDDFGYDAVSQLLSAIRKDVTSGTVQKQSNYTYDKAGNRTVEQVDTSRMKATHNSVNQLTGLTGTGSIPMVIEGTLSEPATVTVGGQPATVDGSNRFKATVSLGTGLQSVPIVATDASSNTTSKHVEFTVSATAADRAITYDADGNTLSDGTRTFGWDAQNRLVKVTIGADVKEFVYNGIGQRVMEKFNGSVSKQWVWDGFELREERNAAGTVTKRYYGQGVVKSATIPAAAGDKFFYTRDHLGSIREVTDSSGGIVVRYSYDAWGRRSVVSGSDLAADFGFTGHYWDEFIGVFISYYRAYDPTPSRWLSRDPLGEEGGMNIYGYVGNDPINMIDELGLEPALNLLSPSDPYNDFAKKHLQPIMNGAAVLFGHSNKDSYYGPDGKPIPIDMVLVGLEKGGWRPGMPILSISCEGMAGGPNSPAAKLSARAGGVSVSAATTKVWPNENGGPSLRDKLPLGDGKWVKDHWERINNRGTWSVVKMPAVKMPEAK